MIWWGHVFLLDHTCCPITFVSDQASSAAVPADPPQSPDQRLADQRDVMAYQGVEDRTISQHVLVLVLVSI